MSPRECSGVEQLGQELLTASVAVQHAILAALLVVEDELHRNARITRPARMGPIATVARQVARIALAISGHGTAPRSIKIARKSLTLVSVGPVTTESPSASNKPWPSLFARLSRGRIPCAHARASVSGVTTAPAISSSPSTPSVSPAIA